MMEVRLIEALTQGEDLMGRLDNLARRFGATQGELRECLWQLVRVRAVDVHTQPAGYLTVRRERRSSQSFPASPERRRYRRESWML
jgi:hypothetical protein